MVQELGGFSSLLSAFYVSRSFSLNHYFLEPAFFKGRCFILKNTWRALEISHIAEKVSPPLLEYVERAVRNRSIVIPDKDKFHYLGLFSKIFRVYNFRRFVEKVLDRYLLKRRRVSLHMELYNQTFKNVCL